MALEAVVFPQLSHLGHTCKEFYTMGGDGTWSFESSCVLQELERWDADPTSFEESVEAVVPSTVEILRKRRRKTSSKNKEEVESQRMTHIAVERNRRKQMNDYLSVLKSLMPPSYVKRNDQASIVGSAINYVKELEQNLQSLESQKQFRMIENRLSSPFLDFFNSAQYSYNRHNIEVSVVDSHANLKMLAHRRPHQLPRIVEGLEKLRLTPLHLNVTKFDQMDMYSFSLKVEDDCRCSSSVNEIATQVHRMVEEIQGIGAGLKGSTSKD